MLMMAAKSSFFVNCSSSTLVGPITK
jgi:hypothetical protein